MLRSGPLQLAAQPETHQAVDRRVGDIETELLLEPLPDLLVATEALVLKLLLESFQHRGREHLLPWLGPRRSDVQQGIQPAVLVRRKPLSDGVAMNAQVLGRGTPAPDLARADEDEQVNPPLPLRILRLRQPLLQGVQRLMDLRHDSAHGLLPLRLTQVTRQCTNKTRIWYKADHRFRDVGAASEVVDASGRRVEAASVENSATVAMRDPRVPYGKREPRGE
jgi:hypothetical protein